MKPSVQSTSLAFIAVGVVLSLFGALGLLQLVAVAIGAGLFLRIRYAWWAGLIYSLGNVALVLLGVAIAFLRGTGSWTLAFLALPALTAAGYLYLVVSLLMIRKQFTKDNAFGVAALKAGFQSVKARIFSSKK